MVRTNYNYYYYYGTTKVINPSASRFLLHQSAPPYRNIGEIRELAGCDKITVSPQLLAELEACTEPLPRRLWPGLRESPDAKLSGITASLFSNLHDADLMAVEKLEQGILGFAADQKKLEAQIAKLAAEGAVRPSQ